MNRYFLKFIVFQFALLSFFQVNSQNKFELKGKIKKQTISFKLMSNLIVFPIEVNGKELNFILDSGVGSTILFNLNTNDSISLNNLKKRKLQGLGSEDAVDAILSSANTFKLKNIIGNNQGLYVVYDDSFDLSSKLGITVHGIIGYEILKDFIVKISYGAKKITFYNRDFYNESVCNKCEVLDLEFYGNKPYINAEVQLSENQEATPVKLLIDSGGSDAMWLFENSHPDLVSPDKYFIDFLGEGLSGTIYGKRTFIQSLNIGRFKLKKPTVSYPDSLAIIQARKFETRNGSLGATILKRFVVTLDYANKTVMLKKGKAYNDPFRYNMSGIELVHNGKILVKEREKNMATLGFSNATDSEDRNRVILNYRYKYAFKNTYKIFKLREGSPAHKAGLMVGDVIIKINGKYTFDMPLEEITERFYRREGTKISVLVERLGQNYEYSFRLENILK
jgi:hypothetical protein